MEEKDYLADISEIKNMMAKSSQFISLSGLSGILAGIYALVGAHVANTLLKTYQINNGIAENTNYTDTPLRGEIVFSLFAVAFAVFALSLVTGITLSARKARKAGEKFWNSTSKRLAVNFAIPLVTGGIFALILIEKENYDQIAGITLIFYGLACVNAGKYTFRDVRYLGLTIVILGLAAAAYPQYSIYLWAAGFGICHIFYGTIMHFKYDRK